MKNTNILVHIMLAAFVSFGISIAVWISLDIFNPVGFWIASLAACGIGAFVGWASGRYLAGTLAVTILLRSAILFFAIGG